LDIKIPKEPVKVSYLILSNICVVTHLCSSITFLRCSKLNKYLIYSFKWYDLFPYNIVVTTSFSELITPISAVLELNREYGNNSRLLLIQSGCVLFLKVDCLQRSGLAFLFNSCRSWSIWPISFGSRPALRLDYDLRLSQNGQLSVKCQWGSGSQLKLGNNSG